MAEELSDFLWPPETFEDEKVQHTVDIIFAQLRALTAAVAGIDTTGGGTGGTAPHDLLSATHPDTVPATEVDGDLIVGSGGKWRRLPKGTNKHFLQLVTGLPAWGVDGSLLTSLPGSAVVGALPVGSYLHNFLSAAHPDTLPAAPSAGAMVTGGSATTVDLGKYWLRGRRHRGLSGQNTGARAYWLRGAAVRPLGAIPVPFVWQKLLPGASGAVLTSTGSGVAWQTVGAVSGSSGASVYRSADVLVPDLTPTTIVLDTVTTDDGTYWSAGSPTRLTVPSGASGWHVIVGQATWQIGTLAVQWLALFVNGVERARTAYALTNSVKADPHQAAALVKLNTGDYIELKVEQAANAPGTPFFVRGGSAATFLSALKV